MSIEYPKPRTGVGLHDSADKGANPPDIRSHARRMQAAGISVYKILADGANKVGRCEVYLEHGIVPIVRLYEHRPHPRWNVNVDHVRAYVGVGARYIESGNEPNIGSDEFYPFPSSREEFGRLLGEQWLRHQDQIKRAGGIPLFFAMTPGGAINHRDALQATLGYLDSINALSSFEGCAIGMHPRPLNNPPDTPFDYEPRFPGHIPNTTTWNEHRWIIQFFNEALGFKLPAFATEHGYSPFDSQNSEHPPMNKQTWAEYNKALFERMNPAHPNAADPQLWGICYWLESQGGTWEGDRAFGNWFPTDPTEWGWALLGMTINWNRAETPAPKPPAPPPTPPTPTPTPPPTGKRTVTDDGVTLTIHPAQTGGAYWRVRDVRILNDQESRGMHHVFVRAYRGGERVVGATVKLTWPGGESSGVTEAKPLGEWGDWNAPLYGSGWALGQGEGPYSVMMDGTSERVSGMGLPSNHHFSYVVTFEEATAAPPPPPPPREEPTVDRLAEMLQAEFGAAFRDVRAQLNLDGDEFGYYDSRKMKYIVIHHSTGGRVEVSVEGIAKFHDIDRGWSGIGYHFVIDEGVLYYTGSVDTQRAHILNRNHEGLGVCFTGDYNKTEPAAEDVEIGRRLVRVLDAYYGHKKELTGHRHLMAPGYTTCPGDRLARIIPLLRVEVAPEPATPPAPVYAVGSGFAALMEKNGDTPTSNEEYHEGVYSLAEGKKGTYIWLKKQNRVLFVPR